MFGVDPSPLIPLLGHLKAAGYEVSMAALEALRAGRGALAERLDQGAGVDPNLMALDQLLASGDQALSLATLFLRPGESRAQAAPEAIAALGRMREVVHGLRELEAGPAKDEIGRVLDAIDRALAREADRFGP